MLANALLTLSSLLTLASKPIAVGPSLKGEQSVSSPAATKRLPPVGTISATIDLRERLRILAISDADLHLARQIWDTIEPEARSISEAHWQQWKLFFGDRANIAGHDHDRMIELGIQYLRNRLLHPDRLDWVESAERSVAGTYAADVPLIAILSMTCVGGSRMLEILSQRLDCSKEHRLLLTDVLFRLRSLEAEVYTTIYSAYFEFDSRMQRDELAADFREGIAHMVEEATHESAALRGQSMRTSISTRGMLGKTSEVAAAAEQSAVAMREAAQTAAGLIRAIEDARSEVEAAAEIATRASGQAGVAVGMSETLSDHAKSIESILGLIRDIAGQTNLLALNATIEAAREIGRAHV